MSANPSRWESSAPIRYPDPNIVVLDPRFRHLVVSMAAIERIATGFRFTEGPAWFGDGHPPIDALIIGSALKKGGLWSNPLDPDRCKAITAARR